MGTPPGSWPIPEALPPGGARGLALVHPCPGPGPWGRGVRDPGGPPEAEVPRAVGHCSTGRA
eukprot:8336890-Alexandrium_andersonii.AAC.1